MPSDATHTIFNFTIFAVISVFLFKFPIMSVFQYVMFTAFYLLGTLVLSPDLDTNSKASQRCGLACKPYKWVFHHRGASHHWLWGTFARIGYVAIICMIVLLILGMTFQSQDLGTIWGKIIKYKYEALAGIGGLFISNILHIFLDKIA